MAEKKEIKDANPSKTVKKSPKLVHVHTNVSYASRTVVTFISHPKCLNACLIKWTTSGEPPVGLKLTRALNWVTVQSYFILFFYCDHVVSMAPQTKGAFFRGHPV